MGEATLRTGVIGVGTMGERHARLYAQSPNAQLVGVYDANPDRAREVAVQWQTRAFPTVEQLLGAVEAVSVASSTHTHASLAALALAAGVHLLIEKPVADSLPAARLLALRAAQRPGLVVQVGHIERFNPVVRTLRHLLQGQRIVSLTAQRLSLFDGRCLDTDVIQDLMIHDLDLALSFCGNGLTLLGATGSSLMSARIDQATAHLRSAGGARLCLEASRVADRKVRAITVTTERARYDADLMHKAITVTGQVGDSPRPVVERCVIPADEPLRLELDHFIECALGRRQPEVGIEAGVRALIHAEEIGAAIAARQFAPTFGEMVAAGDGLAAGA